MTLNLKTGTSTKKRIHLCSIYTLHKTKTKKEIYGLLKKVHINLCLNGWACGVYNNRNMPDNLCLNLWMELGQNI